MSSCNCAISRRPDVLILMSSSKTNYKMNYRSMQLDPLALMAIGSAPGCFVRRCIIPSFDRTALKALPEQTIERLIDYQAVWGQPRASTRERDERFGLICHRPLKLISSVQVLRKCGGPSSSTLPFYETWPGLNVYPTPGTVVIRCGSRGDGSTLERRRLIKLLSRLRSPSPL